MPSSGYRPIVARSLPEMWPLVFAYWMNPSRYLTASCAAIRWWVLRPTSLPSLALWNTSVRLPIGAAPKTEWLAGVLERDPAGFLRTGPDLLVDGRPLPGWPLERNPFYLEASVPGVFVAGDVRAESVKRVASAVGEGAMAVTLVHRYLDRS